MLDTFFKEKPCLAGEGWYSLIHLRGKGDGLVAESRYVLFPIPNSQIMFDVIDMGNWVDWVEYRN